MEASVAQSGITQQKKQLTRVWRLYYWTAGFYLLLDALAVGALVLMMAGVLGPIPGITWLRVHLLTIGVVTQVIFGVLPRLTAAKLDTRPPGPGATALIWLLVNLSFVLLLYSMTVGNGGVAAIGATGVFAAVVLMLIGIGRQGASPRAPGSASVRFYVAGPIFFLVGILMALSMLLAWPSPGGFFGILEGHVHANVWGFLALVAAGFLLAHVPEWAGRPLPYPSLVSTTWWLLTVGGAGLVAGPWLAILPMTLIGIVIYMAGSLLLLMNVAGTILAARGRTPNLAHIVIAYAWMVVPAIVAPAVLFKTGKLPTGAVETAAVAGLVAGWILQVVLGALPLRLRQEEGKGAAADGSWFSVVALNLGVLSMWASAFWPDPALGSALLTAGYALILAGWLPPLLALLRQLASMAVASKQVRN